MKKACFFRAGARQAGLSLTEVLIAAALLLLIAISIIPIFQRAVVSNISGGEATQVSTGGVRVGLESMNQMTVNHPDITIPETSNALALDPLLLDTGTLIEGQAQALLGDERWIAAPDWPSSEPTLTGRALWVRQTQLRNFTYADIHSGTISVTGNTVVTLGDPYYFDTPRVGNETWDIKENRVEISGNRESGPLGPGQHLAVGMLRAY